jgi:catechol 2,3-dioxygenase-like lactoylglutathione lyase family enzyme
MNFKATDEFYKSHFGLITSDECFNDAGEICLTFNRVDRGKEYVDHHTLLTIPSPQAGLGHIAFEVHDINHIFLGHEFLKKMATGTHGVSAGISWDLKYLTIGSTPSVFGLSTGLMEIY